MKYEDISRLSKAEIEAALARDHPEELRGVVLAAALHGDDPAWAEAICMRLADHADAGVRGNAVLGLGHLARLHGRLDMKRVKPVLAAALVDVDAYVRGQAEAAADDVELFIGVRVRA